MGSEYKVREEVFNANIKQWEKINSLCSGAGSMVITPQQFFSYVGACGALTVKCNQGELEFFGKINELARL